MFAPYRQLLHLPSTVKFLQTCLNQTRCKSTAVKLQGLVAAPVTPFDKNGELQTNCLLDKCAQYFRMTHFNGVFVAGTMGEGVAMSCAERKILAERWRELTDDKLFLIVHIGTGNYKETQELARHAEDLGVDAIAALPPTYQKPQTEQQLVDYLQKVGAAAPNTPLLYYDYNITTNVYLNIPRMLELAVNKLYLPTLSLGIPDVITVPYFGEIFHSMKKAFDDGDMAEAQILQRRAQKLVDIQQKYGGGIACAKAVFELMANIPVGPPRLPLHGLSTEKYQLLQADLEAEGYL